MRVLNVVVSFAAATAVVGASLAPAMATPRPMPAPAFQRGTIPESALWRPDVLLRSLRLSAFDYPPPHANKFLPSKSITANPKEWLMDGDGYIWGLSGNKVVTYLSDCYSAEAGIVDHAGRLIVACTSSTIYIYNKGNVTGPANVVLNDNVPGGPTYYPFDAFEDTHGTIYAANAYGYRGSTQYPGNIVWWTSNNQQTGATPSGSYSDQNLSSDYYADVDKNGTVYVDGFTKAFVSEVDEITNIMTIPTVTNLNIPLHFPGGVYVVSPRGPKPLLSVIDTGSNKAGNDALYQYTLPVSPGPAPITTSHPPQNIGKTCAPVAGGYDKSATHIYIADYGCHGADLGVPATDSWKFIWNYDFGTPTGGAFIPSDK